MVPSPHWLGNKRCSSRTPRPAGLCGQNRIRSVLGAVEDVERPAAGSRSRSDSGSLEDSCCCTRTPSTYRQEKALL